MREYRTNRTHFCVKEEMGAVDVPLKLTAYHAGRRGNNVQGTVDIDVATEPSTAHQRTNRGLIQSVPNWSARLITIVDGTNVVKPFVTRMEHGRAPDNTRLS